MVSCALLRVSLSTTNIIESCLSRMEHVTGRVKRWQGGDHVQRWMATALLEGEKKFRTVKDFRSIKDLMNKMNASIAQKIAYCVMRESHQFQLRQGQPLVRIA